MVKLLDYELDWAGLEASRNPFAVVVMAQLKTKETYHQPQERKWWRYRLTTMLYDQGYGEQDMLETHNFLDWLMKLPETLERQFQSELKAFEETRQMKYVTTIERMAKAEGKAEGKAEEKTAIALNLLKENLTIEVIAQATGLTIEQVQVLQTQAEQSR
jgi:predicted transposase/invertase (TIGR01784 family)